MIIYRVSIILNKESYQIFTQELEVKETANSYTKPSLRLDKSKMLLVQTDHYEYPGIYQYYTYCLPDDFSKARELLTNKVKDRLLEDIDKMKAIERTYFVGYGAVPQLNQTKKV